jgi:hypothetical protein
MRDCELLSDRMTAVALGRSEWAADETLHLASCESCQEQWRLLQIANGLADGTPTLNVPELTSRLQQRLRLASLERRGKQRAWGFAGLATAAGLAAAIWTGSQGTRPEPVRPPPQVVAGRLQISLPELDDLQPSELDSVLQTMDEPSTGGSKVEVPGLGELDDTELKTVLDTWEG